MDYLCELPNDAARRKALKNLPRGLNPTYERILRHVKESNEEAQKLVRRTLKWIAHDKNSVDGMTTEQLCEAISINLGDKCRDLEAVPDETEILRNCSSLVRLSVDGRRFEFAHFTVEEFLKSLDGTKDGEFAAYHISSNHIENELSKVCFTYLNFLDFDKGGNASKEITTDRFKQCAFREYVVSYWEYHACVSDWNDTQLFSLATELFHPSKPNTLISLVQDQIPDYSRYGIYPNEEALAIINCGITEATALHYAAMYSLSEVCKWLIENGCDVNRRSAFGTPLHCAQLSFTAFSGSFYGITDDQIFDKTAKELETIDLLLNAGADPNINYHSTSGELSPLFLAVRYNDLVTTQRLLQKGAIVDDRFVNLVIEHAGNDEAWDYLQNILENAKNTSLGEETRARALQYALRAHTSGITGLFPLSARSDEDKNDRNRHNEATLRTAAEYGQVKAVLRLLDDHGVDADAVEENTLLTALHYASMKDQLEVAQVLLERGASPSKADYLGKTALHYCVKGEGCRCLSFFLKQSLDLTVADSEHLTVWHLAALEKNIEALKILISNVTLGKPPNELKGSKERPLISCASQSGSAEAVSLLLDAGCSVFDLDPNGCTALHHGAKAGSPEVVRLLIAQGLDVSAKTHDGSSTIHYAIMGNSAGLDMTLEVLLDDRVNPCIGRKDGIMPMRLLIGDGTDSANDMVREKALQRLASLPESFQGKQEDLTQALNVICHFPPSQHSIWLLTGLKTLLENGADMSRSYQGQTALEALLAVWQGECSESECSEPVFQQPPVNSSITSSEMVLAALEHIPFQGPLHEICAEPGLLLSAVEVSNDQLAYKLLDHSPDVDKIVDDSNNSPIRAACQIGSSRILLRKLLERSNALSDKALGSDLVREACQQGNEENHEALLELLEAGLDPNGPSAQGQTALMFAALGGNIDMVESLFSHGSDAKATDHAGRTVAHYACIYGHLDVLFALRDKGVDWNATARTKIKRYRREGITVLHLAAVLEDDSVLKYLLEEDFVKDVDGVTDLKETALFVAAWMGKPRNVALLLSKNGDPALVVDPGESSIHVAARCGEISVISEFINYGCNLKIPNSQGLDSEMIAWKHGHTELAKMIGRHTREHGTLPLYTLTCLQCSIN
jgi:ankyrin repeat protein